MLGFVNLARESSLIIVPCPQMLALSTYELYLEPVVVSVFLAFIYCLCNFKVNSMMPENLKTNVPVLYISD